MHRRLSLFDHLCKATFLARPNRFVVECLLRGRKTPAYLPNPGRLRELLLPGATLYLTDRDHNAEKRMPCTAVAVEREGIPVLLHTHLTNSVARWLIDRGMIPGIEGYRVVKSEVGYGSSRFDFLLHKGSEEFVLEVKSCTLFGKRIAMFPDAVTERGTRHLRELSALRRKGLKSGVLFIVHWPKAEHFLPEYHTDLTFSRTLHELRTRLFIKAVSVTWKKDLSLGEEVRELDVPWPVLGAEAHDRGAYILLLSLKRNERLSAGSLSHRDFRKGYYLYVGSAMKNLSQRIERHKRARKNLHWHIDHLRARSEFLAALPVRSSARLECDLADALSAIAQDAVPGFGCSDCSCASHLFRMDSDPLSSRHFINLLQYYRIDRLEGILP